MITTSFQIDYDDLSLLQKRANELGFRSWGAFLRHAIDLHAALFEPDLLARFKRREVPDRCEGHFRTSDASTGRFRSKKQHR